MRVKCPRGAAARGRVRWVSRAGLSEVCPSVRMVACSVLAARVGLYCPRGIAASHATRCRSLHAQVAGRQVRLRGGWTQSATSRSVKNGRTQKNRILITQVSSFIHTQARHDPQDSYRSHTRLPISPAGACVRPSGLFTFRALRLRSEIKSISPSLARWIPTRVRRSSAPSSTLACTPPCRRPCRRSCRPWRLAAPPAFSASGC